MTQMPALSDLPKEAIFERLQRHRRLLRAALKQLVEATRDLENEKELKRALSLAKNTLQGTEFA